MIMIRRGFLTLLMFLPWCDSFTSTIHTRNNHNTRLLMANWDDVVINAQSAASSLASTSLEDPSNLLSSIPVIYGAGLLTSVSPCVWGLLPLTMSYISTAAGEREDKDIALPTLAFALGLATVFCSLGLAAATVGGVVYGNSGSTNILLPLVSNAICCLMGFQLLDLVTIPLLSLQTQGGKLKKQSNDQPILIDGSGKIMSTDDDKKEGSLFRTFLLGGFICISCIPLCYTSPYFYSSLRRRKLRSSAWGGSPSFLHIRVFNTPTLDCRDRRGKH